MLLYCTVLYCIVLYCIVLFCFALLFLYSLPYLMLFCAICYCTFLNLYHSIFLCILCYYTILYCLILYSIFYITSTLQLQGWQLAGVCLDSLRHVTGSYDTETCRNTEKRMHKCHLKGSAVGPKWPGCPTQGKTPRDSHQFRGESTEKHFRCISFFFPPGPPQYQSGEPCIEQSVLRPQHNHVESAFQ